MTIVFRQLHLFTVGEMLSAGSAVRATGWPILAEALAAQIVGFFVVPALGDLGQKPLPGGRRPKRNAARNPYATGGASPAATHGVIDEYTISP
jgi:hypothetical protein